jgi:nucleoside-diphosphate-sugar epimerase
MANCLVTGGAGFIGSHLVEALLARGDTVRVLDNLSSGNLQNLNGVINQIEFIEGDIRDEAIAQ